MSLKMNIITPNKKEIAEVLRSIATMIANSSNKTVTVELELTFNPKDK